MVGKIKLQINGNMGEKQGYLVAHGLRQRCGDVEHLPHSRWEGGLPSRRPRFSRGMEPFYSGICCFDPFWFGVDAYWLGNSCRAKVDMVSAWGVHIYIS